MNITPNPAHSLLIEMAYFIVGAGILIMLAFWLFAAFRWIMEWWWS